MPHHFTKDTVEASVWCNACGKMARWRVLGGRRGYCIECQERKEKERGEAKPEEPAAVQEKLF